MKLKGSCRVVMSVNFRHIVVFDVSKKVIVNFAMELTVNYYPGLVPGIFIASMALAQHCMIFIKVLFTTAVR